MKQITRPIAKIKLWDPTNVGWWLLMVLGVGGLVYTIVQLAPGISRFPVAAAVGVVLSIPFAALWWFGLRAMQIGSRIAISGRVWAVVWGAGAAVGLYALPGNGAIIEVLGQQGSVATALDWGAAVAAPITEETGKLLGVVAIIIAARTYLRNPMDGLLIGGYVGLGFCLMENFLYGLNIAGMSFGENEVVSTLAVFFLRAGLFFPISHVIFTALAGAALGFFLGRRPGRSFGWGLLALTLAYGLHFLWNSPLLENWLLRFAVVAVVPLCMWLVVHRARKSEFAYLTSALSPWIRPDAIPADFAGALQPTLIKRMRYRGQVRRSHGPEARRGQLSLEGAMVDIAHASDEGDARAAEARVAQVRDFLRLGSAAEAAGATPVVSADAGGSTPDLVAPQVAPVAATGPSSQQYAQWLAQQNAQFARDYEAWYANQQAEFGVAYQAWYAAAQVGQAAQSYENWYGAQQQAQQHAYAVWYAQQQAAQQHAYAHWYASHSAGGNPTAP